MKFRTSLLIFLLIISAWLAFVSPTYSGMNFPAGPDEYWYFNYAGAFSRQGLSAVRGFFKDYCANSSAWLYPNPLRIGYFALGSFWLKLSGFKYLGLAYLSLLAYLLTLAVSYFFCRRQLGEEAALVFSALLAFSPLGTALSRRALPDTTSNLFIILSLLLFFEYAQKKKAGFLAGFCAAFAFSMLVKETAAVFILFFLLWVIYDGLCARAYFKGKLVYSRLAGIAVSAALAFAVYLALGAAPYLARLARIIINSPSSNQYARHFGSGPWFRYLIDYFLLSPAVFILALFFWGSRFSAGGRKNDFIPYAFACALFTFLIFNLFTKNVRYVFLLDWFLRLCAAMMLCAIASAAGRLKWALLLSSAALLVLYDGVIFTRLFLSCGIYDPVSFTLLKAWNFIP